MALTNVGIPNLIAFDLVAVSPMSAISGNVAYIKYVRGTGGWDGELFNSVYQLGDTNGTYTGTPVVEPVTDFQSGTTKIAFTPVIQDATHPVKFLDADGNELTVTGNVTIADDGTVTATVTGTVAKIAYSYDNIVVPQTALPTLKAELQNIPLQAKARRIAIYYSQMAAFQAKTDYGFSLADGLAEQAVGQLSYEIDTEIVQMLFDEAPTASTIASFSKTQPIGVSLADHYLNKVA